MAKTGKNILSIPDIILCAIFDNVNRNFSNMKKDLVDHWFYFAVVDNIL